ncbi:uncharacterized protein METZ01_LOCUS492320 [marine metagenome]|uniref:Uncharacterized protein n=1 Tax=marine metagenome TaxID=408172 RepID=A0A383D4K1_9ZZZZ
MAKLKAQNSQISQQTPAPLNGVRLELIEVAGQAAHVLGFPRSVGEIYGLLYLAPNSVSAPDICDALSASKGSVSQGLRQLVALGFVNTVRVHGNRRVHYKAILEVGGVLRKGYEQTVQNRTIAAEQKMKGLHQSLGKEESQLDRNDFLLIQDRLQGLAKIQKRIKKLMPLIGALLK